MEILGIGPGEFILILIVLLVVVGPERLPGLARQAAGILVRARNWLQTSPDAALVLRARQEIEAELASLEVRMAEGDEATMNRYSDTYAKFEAAGGYSPTVGIIGAVLGLIQVMKNLDNIDEVGRGIAAAFVATIYGVALANLIFLPAAGKLKFRHREEQMIKEMALEGVISILEGMNPRMIETKLRTYLFDSEPVDSARPSEVGA